VKNWITLNEPSVVSKHGHLDGAQAPGLNDYWAALRVTHNLMRAHGRAVQIYRAVGGDGQIGITVNITPQHPASDSDEDVATADRNDAFLNRAYLDPIFKGSYPDVLPEWFGEAWPDIREGDLDEVHSPIDFLGVNYYTRQMTAHKRGVGVVDAEQVK
jgi:beta-glucosidase